MIFAIACSLLSFTASISPETVYYNSYEAITEGQHAYMTDSVGWWRKSFVASDSGAITVYKDIDPTACFVYTVTKQDMFTLRVFDKPYTSFAVAFRPIPEPCTAGFLIGGIVFIRRYFENN